MKWNCKFGCRFRIRPLHDSKNFSFFITGKNQIFLKTGARDVRYKCLTTEIDVGSNGLSPMLLNPGALLRFG